MSLSAEKILVTGGAGFIGQHLSRALLRQGALVRVLDNFSPQVHATSGLPPDLAREIELVRADVRDRHAVERALDGINCVVHLAAETGTGQSMYMIDRYFDVNVQGTAILLDLAQSSARGKTLRSIIVASSRAVIGEGAYECDRDGIVFPDARNRERLARGQFEPLCPHCGGAVMLKASTESAELKPMSIYGLTKQAQEQAVLMCARSLGITGIALRYQNVYGPGQSLRNPYTGILAIFSNLARQGLPIEIYEDGLESRDFVYVDDVVEATVRSVECASQFTGCLNVGSGQATSVLAVARDICDFFKSASPVDVTGAFRIGDIRHNVADVSLLRHMFGVKPATVFREGLVKFLQWAEIQPPEDRAGFLDSVAELSSRGLFGGPSAV